MASRCSPSASACATTTCRPSDDGAPPVPIRAGAPAAIGTSTASAASARAGRAEGTWWVLAARSGAARVTVDPAEARLLGAATLHEAAGRLGALPATLRPVAPAMRVAGPAYTVRCPPGDNLWIHRAIYAASPGDVLVVATGDTVAEWGYWGEIMAVAALQVGIAGLVLQGGTRDHDALVELGLPIWSLGACIRGTVKDKALDHGRLGEPIRLGDVTVRPGDLVVGDVDGVVAIAHETIGDVVDRSHQRVAKERDVIAALRAGATTLDLYDLR